VRLKKQSKKDKKNKTLITDSLRYVMAY